MDMYIYNKIMYIYNKIIIHFVSCCFFLTKNQYVAPYF